MEKIPADCSLGIDFERALFDLVLLPAARLTSGVVEEMKLCDAQSHVFRKLTATGGHQLTQVGNLLPTQPEVIDGS